MKITLRKELELGGVMCVIETNGGKKKKKKKTHQNPQICRC